MSTTIPINNTTQLERGTAHPIGSTGFNKTDSHHTNTNTHNTSTFAKDGMHANTGAGDTYGHSDTIVKTGQYPTGIENNTTGVPLRTTAHLPSSVSDRNHQPHGAGLAAAATGAHAAHLPAGNAVPVVGGHQNVITGVNNVPTAGPQMQNTVPNAANRDGLVVNDGLGGPLGGAVILGGQCECLANGGACSHGAGKCVCRGCTSQATTVNPGINIGVSTAQYTAPAGTSGFGGGVADKGTGIAGLVQPNPVVNTTNTHHGLTGNHHTTTGHGLTGSHHTGSNTAAAAGAVAGASAMHHASRNVDGDGRHTLGSGHHTTGSNIIGTNTLGSNTNTVGTGLPGTNTYGTHGSRAI